MKKNYYSIEKNINKIYNKDNTNFLDPLTYKKVISSLKGKDYNVLSPYQDCDKVIIYTNNYPKIKLIEIISYDELTHSNIMGSIFNIGIEYEMFGDIIIWNNHYYLLIMDSIYDILKKDFTKVGNSSIKIKEVDISILDNYKRKYDNIEIIVPSLRIDVIITKLIGTSRDNIKKKFEDKEIILNYEECTKHTTNLNIGDIFSIRKHGKYKLDSIIGKTKKNNYIINIKKYISN